MKRNLLLVLTAVFCIAAGSFAGREWGLQNGRRQSLALAARTNLALQLKVAGALRRGDSRDAESRLDASINSLVIELNQLGPPSEPRERSRTQVLFKAVAQYRKEFPDASAEVDGNPSASTVQSILAAYLE